MISCTVADTFRFTSSLRSLDRHARAPYLKFPVMVSGARFTGSNRSTDITGVIMMRKSTSLVAIMRMMIGGVVCCMKLISSFYAYEL